MKGIILNNIMHRLTDAIECPLDADTEILRFWNDKRLDSGVVAEAVNNSGIAVLFRLDGDADAEFCQLSWEELEQGLSEWQALGDQLATERLSRAVADEDRLT